VPAEIPGLAAPPKQPAPKAEVPGVNAQPKPELPAPKKHGPENAAAPKKPSPLAEVPGVDPHSATDPRKIGGTDR
jgi:hypothetical protein